MSSFYNALRFLEEGDEFEDGDHHDEEHDDDTPWGPVIGACLVVQMVTLIGVFSSAAFTLFNKSRERRGKESAWAFFHSFVIPSFAAGALLATAVFLLIPESLELISGGHEEHSDEEDHEEDEDHEDDHRRFLEEHGELESHNNGTWKFGAALLGGFLFPVLLHACFPVPDEDASAYDKTSQEEDADAVAPKEAAFEKDVTGPTLDVDAEQPVKSAAAAASEEIVADEGAPVKDLEESPTSIGCTEAGCCDNDQPEKAVTVTKDWGLATSILVGDFFHNFTDGVFIGTSFLLCGNDVGWTLVATTVYHELAQEIADFALLTHRCGLSVFTALLLNFISGFSVILGGIVVLATDVSDLAKGVILAISAGVYFYIGGASCIPRIQQINKSMKDTLIFFICFTLGAVPIGLVLLNHGHCDAHGDEHSEEHEEGEDHAEDDHDDERYFF